MSNTPAAEVHIDEELVRRLLHAQVPALGELPLVPLANGWDNVIYRLGDGLTVRLPRRAVAAPLVTNEQRWLGGLAAHLPLPIPAPIHKGEPASEFPWPWSINPWFPGDVAMNTPPAEPVEAARVIGEFLRALHQAAPGDAPRNPWRGVPLVERVDSMAAYLDFLGDDRPRGVEVWETALRQDPWSEDSVWVHGDLHPGNIVVDGGRVTAVIDFGDITSGDPATDLAVAWMMFDKRERAAFRSAYGAIDEATWTRSKGWGLLWGLAIGSNSADNAPYLRLSRQVLDRVLAE